MNFREQTLKFTDKKIYYIDRKTGEEIQVMMDWEDELMKKSAEYVCENGGDILEIGFGMGISADFIQANNINSHTIVEYHPEIYNKALAWAENKPKVNIVLGDWYQVRNHLLTYDGIFYDTWGDENAKHLKQVMPYLMKKNGLATWWNSYLTEDNQLKIEADSYEVIPVTPDSNLYFNHTEYYLPKKQY